MTTHSVQPNSLFASNVASRVIANLSIDPLEVAPHYKQYSFHSSLCCSNECHFRLPCPQLSTYPARLVGHFLQ